MTQQFTANEVREELHEFLDFTGLWPRAGNMLRAFADLLEVREKAVPVAYAEFADNGCVRMWSRGYEERSPGTRMVPLYTHPAPADADGLAEALRDDEHEWPASLNIRDTKLHDDMGGPGQRIYTTAGRGYKTMKYIRHDLAHSAQAQPPAARVPGELAEPSTGVLNYEQELSFAEGWNACRKAMLAAQENPND